MVLCFRVDQIHVSLSLTTAIYLPESSYVVIGCLRLCFSTHLLQAICDVSDDFTHFHCYFCSEKKEEKLAGFPWRGKADVCS